MHANSIMKISNYFTIILYLGGPYVSDRWSIKDTLFLTAARLHDVMIHVTHYYSTNSELSTSELCAQVEGPFQLGETRHVHCSQDVVGRYVIISLPGNEEILTLCEVQVYGVRGRAIMGDKQRAG